MVQVTILAMVATILLVTTAFALEIGDKAPNFTLSANNGETVTLSEYIGDVVVVNFWATWCPPCRGEMPEFDEMNKVFTKEGDVHIIAVNMTDGRRDSKKKVDNFIAKYNYSLKVLYDEKSSVAQAYGVQYLPTTYVIGKDGKITGKIIGGTNKQTVMGIVRKAQDSK